MIGSETRNSERGSGGEKAAPRTNVMNQMCLRYAINVGLSIAPEFRQSRVMSGALKSNHTSLDTGLL